MITLAGIEINDIGGSLSWGAFDSFLRRLPITSAVHKDLHPEIGDWDSSLRTNILLADIYDCLSQINANMIGGFSRKKAPKFKKYPRPWSKKNGKSIGKNALPKNQLHEWINKKRKEARDKWLMSSSQEPM